jgi:hypothetical protein
MDVKILSMPFFGGEVKECPMSQLCGMLKILVV